MTRVLWPYVLGSESPIPYLFESIAPHFDEEFQFRSLAQDGAGPPDAVSGFTLSTNWRPRRLVQYVRFSLSRADLIHTGARERMHRRVSQLSKFRNRDIAHVHTFRVDVNPDGKFDTSAFTEFARQADTVTAVSDHTAETVREHVGIDPEVVYNGVDTEWFHPYYERPALFDDYGLDEPVFLYVGFMEQRKRPDHVLAAAEAIPEGSFLLIGDGPMLDDLRELAGNLDNVFFPGRIAKDRLPAIYANARALVFPTVREGCPNVVLESMAAGTPVIGYRATSMPELVDHGETGLLAPTNEVDSLTENVAEMARREDSGLGSCARSCVRKYHKFETIADDYESLYRATL
jgi:glycosyltransferase involved in cell wall biosynthesis